MDNESYEKDVIFYVELGEPIREEGISFFLLSMMKNNINFFLLPQIKI